MDIITVRIITYFSFFNIFNQLVLIMRGFLLGVCFLVFVTYVQGTGYCSRQDHYNPFGTVLCSFFGRLARENDKCSITCGYGHILEGTQKIVCRNWKWSGSLGDCKAITCPPLSPVQLASVSPRSCLTRPSRIDHFCIFTCPEGYHGKGHWGTEERRFCTVNGKWTGNDIICEDGQKPEITCPKDITVPTDPGQATAKIKLLKAAYSDNSQKVDPNAKLVLKSNVPLESDMKIGKHYGRYTVQDSAGLIASCNFGITVEDREPPKIMNCPNDITKVVDNNRARINWNEPKITDNSGEVTIYSDIFNGSEFPLGTRTVTYTVKDKSFNTNKCSFQVTVKQTCKDVNLPHPPFPKCSFLAADLSKCDETDWRYFPENLKWKDFCRKTCKVC